MRSRRLLGTCLAGALVLCATSSAAAQDARDPALAETLFNSAQACLARDDWACACEKFAASMTADPSVSTLFNIARCQEHDGKLALAWASLQDALHLNQTLAYHEVRRKKLDEYGQKMALDLARRVPRLRISVADRPPGVEVRRGGAVVPLAALDEPILVDPGTHEIVVTAPGYVTARRVITLVEGQEQPVALSLVRVAPAALARVAPLVSAAPAPSPGASAQGLAGLAVGGVGVLALGTAGVLGIVTAVDVQNAEGSVQCRTPVNDDLIRQCNGFRAQARAVQTASIAVAIAGSVTTATGVVLWATTPKRAAAPGAGARGWSVAAHPWGASLTGRF